MKPNLSSPHTACPDCDSLSRRRFLQHTLVGAAALSAAPLLAAPTFKSKSETLAAQLYSTLTPQQRAVVCFPFEHELRPRSTSSSRPTSRR
jgi:hypothetical protein